jgi:hypothetical protein
MKTFIASLFIAQFFFAAFGFLLGRVRHSQAAALWSDVFWCLWLALFIFTVLVISI